MNTSGGAWGSLHPLRRSRRPRKGPSQGMGDSGEGATKEHAVPPRQAERDSRDGPSPEGGGSPGSVRTYEVGSVRIRIATREKPEHLVRRAVHLRSVCGPFAVCLKIKKYLISLKKA